MSENNSQLINNHENNLNKDDIIKLRREARRRKILDNAANRLEKLNGRKIPMQNGDIKTKIDENNDETKINLQKEIENLFGGNDNGNSSDSLLRQYNNDIANTGIQEQDIATKLIKQLGELNENQFNLFNFELPTPSSSSGSASLTSSPSLNDFIFNQNNDLFRRDPLSSPSSSSSSSPSLNFMKKFLIYRLHLILLALFIYCTKDKLLLIDKYSIFLPLLLMKSVEIIIKKYVMKSLSNTLSSSMSYLDIALLLGGISPKRSKLFLQIFNFVTNLIHDIAFYLFSFTMIHLCIGKIIYDNNNDDDNLYINNIKENIHDEI